MILCEGCPQPLMRPTQGMGRLRLLAGQDGPPASPMAATSTYRPTESGRPWYRKACAMKTKTVACPCGAVIPFRNVYDHYRLTPRHREIRAQHRIGAKSSQVRAFLDTAEAATRQGEPVLRFAPTPRDEARVRAVLQRCERAGYLEYVCPQCTRPLGFLKTSRRDGRVENAHKKGHVMEPEYVKPGTAVKQRQDEQQMVIVWVEADGESVRCRWLDGLEWKDASFRIADLDIVAA